jgi:uncharacterized protein
MAEPHLTAMQPDKDSNAPFAARPCPICGHASTFAQRPFCSKRCADIDLHRWFSGTYVVPTPPDAVEDESTSADEAKPEQA